LQDLGVFEILQIDQISEILQIDQISGILEDFLDFEFRVILTSFRKDKLDNESRRVFLDFQAVY
jgi:hypothetical protein